MNNEHEYLLDTHALVWYVEAPSLLSSKVRKTIASSRFVVSAASFWEMILKASKRDGFVTEPGKWWHRYIVQTNVPVLAIEAHHIKHLETLPLFHKDPFDRLLICQSMSHGLKLVTKDQNISRYKGLVSQFW